MSLAIVYPSFIFCEWNLVYYADFYKWLQMTDGKILWKIVESSMWFDVSFDLFLNCWHFWVVLLLPLLSLRFCFVLITLFDWSHGGRGFGESQRYSQSLFLLHWKQLKRGQWYFRDHSFLQGWNPPLFWGNPPPFSGYPPLSEANLKSCPLLSEIHHNLKHFRMKVLRFVLY